MSTRRETFQKFLPASLLMTAGAVLLARRASTLGGLVRKLTATREDLTRRLHEAATDKELMERELSAAREIQEGILPKVLPQCPNRDEFKLHAMIKPARGVGGDLYDYFWVDQHHFFFMIGDVSEKGVPAALLMAVTKTLIQSHMRPDVGLCQALARVNDRLAHNNESLMFVTVFCGLLDVRTGEVECCDGGHNEPCLLPHEGPARMMKKKTGIALGYSPGFQFQSEKITLAPGASIFLYTDGITEAMNARRDQYTEARLQDMLTASAGKELPALVMSIMEDVQRFAADEPQSDDIAMLVLRYQGLPPASAMGLTPERKDR